MQSIRSLITAHPIITGITLLLIMSFPGFSHAQEETFYFLTDHLGSVEVVLDEDANVVERRDTLPYGTSRSLFFTGVPHGNYTVEPRSFTGKQLDTQTGLHYYSARYYDSDIGRFTTIDPLVLDEAKTTPEDLLSILSNPQKLNAYTYVLNNPLMYTDPFGESAESMAGFGRMVDGGVVIVTATIANAFYPKAKLGAVAGTIGGTREVMSGFMLATTEQEPKEFSKGGKILNKVIDGISLRKVPVLKKSIIKKATNDGYFEKKFRAIGDTAERMGEKFGKMIDEWSAEPVHTDGAEQRTPNLKKNDKSKQDS